MNDYFFPKNIFQQRNFSIFYKLFLLGGMLILICFGGCKGDQNLASSSRNINNTLSIPYPISEKANIVDNYFGVEIEDPYRWLEQTTDVATIEWLNAQQTLSQSYLNTIEYKKKIGKRISELASIENYDLPILANEEVYYFKTTLNANLPILYKQDTVNGDEIILNPNVLSKNGEVTIGEIGFSDDGRYLAFERNYKGQSRGQIVVKDLKKGKYLTDTLNGVVNSRIIWHKKGFYYTSYPSNKFKFHKVYYHRLGTKQTEDKLIFANRSESLHNFSIQTTSDKQFLTISAQRYRTGNALYFKRMDSRDDIFVPLFPETNYDFQLVDNIGDKLLVRTNYKAPNYRAILIDTKKPDESNWEEIVPSKEEVLKDIYCIENGVICNYIDENLSNNLLIYSETTQIEKIEIPIHPFQVTGIVGKPNSSTIYVKTESYTHPSTIYKYDYKSKTIESFKNIKLPFDPRDFITRRFSYPTEGESYPLILAYRKGMQPNGENPTLLTGYGGFNKSMLPTFDPAHFAFMEKGGILAIAILKGGGERGTNWHKAGTLFSKPLVFDDFLRAADFLLDDNYTTPELLAIEGKENGGLLVSTALTKRPDLFRVVIAQSGIVDMLRYDKFTRAYQWTNEYGSSQDSIQFRTLQDYSPLHNVTANLNYPAVLITTGQQDDVVTPGHSYKLLATLQDKTGGNSPILLSTSPISGHEMIQKEEYITQTTNKLAFLFYNLGVEW